MQNSKDISTPKQNRNMVIQANENIISPEYGHLKIEGFYHPEFKKVYEEFKNNFITKGEIGASTCITRKGDVVLDLWGGLADVEKKIPWKEDTVSIIFSTTKGAVGFAFQILVSRGLIDINAPVSKYWPEYAKNGKEKTTVKMLLTHQSGVLHLSQPLKEGAFADWDYTIKAIEDQKPFFEPGTGIGYQMYTHGWLLGEIIQRVSGKSVQTFFQEEIAAPLNLDFWFGLPSELYDRAATVIPPALTEPYSTFWLSALKDPQSPQGLSLHNDGGFLASLNSPLYKEATMPSVNGYTNARGLAKMYRPLALGGKYEEIQFLDKKTLSTMNTEYASGLDKMLLINNRMGLGFTLSVDNRAEAPENRDIYILSDAAFGAPGYGGSTGFADPVEKVSFGYTMNKLGDKIYLSERGQSLVDAMYLSLGYKSNTSGVWTK